MVAEFTAGLVEALVDDAAHLAVDDVKGVRGGRQPVGLLGVVGEGGQPMPLVLLLFVRRRSPGDGLLVGVASGAGFAVFETMGYAFVELVQSGGDLHVVDHLLVVRGLLSPAAHMAWTGLTIAALWSAAAHHWRRRSVGVLVLVYAIAVGLHTAWDSFDDDTAYAVLAAVSLSLLVFTAHRLAGQSRSPGISLPATASAVAPASHG
jgi:RsiW-degrading membrane proteinase PrsW (M82 family)